MKTLRATILPVLLFICLPAMAQETPSAGSSDAGSNSWTKTPPDRSKRGELHDAFQKVRGDSGKWNDEPRLQIAPPISRKPTKLSLDDWADQWANKKFRATSNDPAWLLFKTRQLDDNDRLWVERIERRGNRFAIVLCEAIWQGRYSKTFTYYSVFGVNLGKLAPGDYQATWVVKPLVFRTFEGAGRPRDQKNNDNLPKDDRPADGKAKEITLRFTVTAASP